MKVKMIVASISMLLLVGCSQTVKVVRVPVPVQPPKIEIPLRPVLITKSLPQDTPYNEYVRSILVDFAELLRYSKELETLLEAYSEGIDDSYYQNFGKEITVK